MAECWRNVGNCCWRGIPNTVVVGIRLWNHGEVGGMAEPHRVVSAQTNILPASFYRCMREQQRGAASSNSRCQPVLFQQYSANLSIAASVDIYIYIYIYI